MFAQFKIYIILGVIILALCGTITLLFQRLEAVKDDRDRHAQNYNVVQTDLKRFKDKNGADAISIQELQLTAAELKNEADSLLNQLYLTTKDLGIKKREIQQLLNVDIETRIDSIIIPIRDTTFIYRGDTVRRLATVESRWLSAELAIKENEVEVIKYEARDNIFIALVWYKERKFFVSRWFEKKKYKAVIKSKNPNSKITHAENIRVTKKRGR